MRLSLIAVPLLLVLAATGCTSTDAEPSQQPSAPPPATTSAAPSSAPTPSDETEAAPPQCGDAYVLASNQQSSTPLIGTDEEVLAALDPRPGFPVADALTGLDVLCTVTTTTTADGPPNPDGTPSILALGTAFLGADPDPTATLEAWAAANGYAAQAGSAGDYPERFAPLAADGTTTTKIVWLPVTLMGWDEPRVAEESARLGVDVRLDSWAVFFYDFTIPQG